MLTAFQPPRKRWLPGNRSDPQRRCCGICTQGGMEFRRLISTKMVCLHHFLPGNADCCHQSVVRVFHKQPSSLPGLPVSDRPSLPPFRETLISRSFQQSCCPVRFPLWMCSFLPLLFHPVPLLRSSHPPGIPSLLSTVHPHPSRKDAYYRYAQRELWE